METRVNVITAEYPMDVLAEESNFLEVAYLLWYGELPSKTEWTEFSDAIKNHTMVHEQLNTFFNGFRRERSPYGNYGCCSCCACLRHFILTRLISLIQLREGFLPEEWWQKYPLSLLWLLNIALDNHLFILIIR